MGRAAHELAAERLDDFRARASRFGILPLASEVD